MKMKRLLAIMLTVFMIGIPCMSIPTYANEQIETDLSEVAELVSEYWEPTFLDYDHNNPYLLKRIVVTGVEEVKDYGAIDTCYIEAYEQHVLQFASEEDTKKAYEQMKKELPDGSFYLDEILGSDILESIPVETRDQISMEAQTGDELLLDGAVTPCEVNSWGMKTMGLDYLKAEAMQREDIADVMVAIVDSGLDVDNSNFAGRKISDASICLFLEDEPENISDVHGHGTAMASVIADGTADNVGFMPIRIYGESSITTLLLFQTAMEYAVDQDVDIINLSMSFKVGNSANNVATRKAVDQVIDKAYEKGIIVICAAGNHSSDAELYYPACNDKVFTISAFDRKLAFAEDFSDYGEAIDYSAPGVDIKCIGIDDEVVYMDGTSMATPHIVAAVAHIKGLNKNCNVDGVDKVLKKYAVDLGDKGVDIFFGKGCPVMTSFYDDYDSEETIIPDPVKPSKPVKPDKPSKPHKPSSGNKGELTDKPSKKPSTNCGQRDNNAYTPEGSIDREDDKVRLEMCPTGNRVIYLTTKKSAKRFADGRPINLYGLIRMRAMEKRNYRMMRITYGTKGNIKVYRIHALRFMKKNRGK